MHACSQQVLEMDSPDPGWKIVNYCKLNKSENRDKQSPKLLKFYLKVKTDVVQEFTNTNTGEPGHTLSFCKITFSYPQ